MMGDRLERLADDTLDDTVEQRVEWYEAACRQHGQAQIEDFLPLPSDPDYARVALELMRVEMERAWQHGTPQPLDAYRRQFADVLHDPERLGALAFEEYRCRRQAGESVRPAEYAQQFSIATTDWPCDTDHDTDPDRIETDVVGLGQESQRLVDAIQLFPDVGDPFLGFRLQERLGQGAFGAVFRARQDDLAGRDVVLKITSGVSQEPQCLALLQHTHIVPVYSVHQSGALQALCMPYFGRVTLAEVLRQLRAAPGLPASGQFFVEVLQRGVRDADPRSDRSDRAAAMPSSLHGIARRSWVDACVSLVARLADALTHAHQRGILHRDIKPANILLTNDGQPMLLDFNISDQLQSRTSLVVGGTLPYMSPEHRRALVTGERVDPRSDVYSLGVVLYQLLCGELPESAAQPWAGPEGASRRKVTSQEIRRRNPQVPPSVSEIVARCLRFDPHQRYASMAALQEDLQCHLADRPLQHARDRSCSERLAKWGRRHPAWVSATSITAVAAVLLTLASGLLLLGWRQIRQRDAVAQLRQLEQQLPEMRVLVSSQPHDAALRRDAVDRLRDLIAPYALGSERHWQQNWRVRALAMDERDGLRESLAELLYLMATAEAQSPASESATAELRVASALHWNQLAQALFAPQDVPAALQLQAEQLRPRTEQAAPHARAIVPPLRTSLDRFLLAQEYLRQARYGPAAQWLESLRDDEPLDYSTWFLLGNAYVGEERLSEAEGCFTTCLTLWPQSYPAYFHRGLCRLQMRHHAAAAADFTQVLQMRADLAAAWFNRALCRKAQGQLTAAVDDLTKALEVGGPEARTYLVLARIREALGQSEQAASDLRQGLELTPRDTSGWLARGLARVDVDPAAALADLREAERRAPASREVLRNQAFVLAEHLRQPAEAIDVLNRLLERAPHPADLMSRGVLRARLGQHDAAVQDGQQALLTRSDDKLQFQMACIYALNCGQYPQDLVPVLSHLARAILANPRWAAVAASDPDLAAVREQAGFRALLQAASVLQQTAQKSAITGATARSGLTSAEDAGDVQRQD